MSLAFVFLASICQCETRKERAISDPDSSAALHILRKCQSDMEVTTRHPGIWSSHASDYMAFDEDRRI